MHIWIVSLFDPTPLDNTKRGRYISIAAECNKLNNKITYFSSTFRHSTRIQSYEETHTVKINDDYEVVFILTQPYHKNISFKRLSSYRGFTKNLNHYIRNQSCPDLVLIAYPPIFPAYWLTKWAKRNGIPLVVDIIDTWPKNLLRLAPKHFKWLFKIFLFPLYYESRVILKNCSGVIGISDQNIAWAKSYGFSSFKTGVFWPAVPFKEIREKIDNYTKQLQPNRDKKLKLIYAGSLGQTYDIPIILKAAEILGKKHPGKSEFLIAGSGYYRELVLEYVNKCENIKYLGRIDHNDLLFYYASSDVGLAQYPRDATQSITYKFFDYLSAGLPILNSLKSEMAVLTEKYCVGFNNPPGDTDQLVMNIEKFLFHNSLLEEYKRNALILASNKGDNEVVYKELVNFLESFN